MKIDKLILLPLGPGQTKSVKKVFRTNNLMKIDKLILLPLGSGQTKSAILLPLCRANKISNFAHFMPCKQNQSYKSFSIQQTKSIYLINNSSFIFSKTNDKLFITNSFLKRITFKPLKFKFFSRSTSLIFCSSFS